MGDFLVWGRCHGEMEEPQQDLPDTLPERSGQMGRWVQISSLALR